MALQAEGFEVTTDGFVYGLILKADWEAHCAYQATPVDSGTPAWVTLAEQIHET